MSVVLPTLRRPVATTIRAQTLFSQSSRCRCSALISSCRPKNLTMTLLQFLEAKSLTPLRFLLDTRGMLRVFVLQKGKTADCVPHRDVTRSPKPSSAAIGHACHTCHASSPIRRHVVLETPVRRLISAQFAPCARSSRILCRAGSVT